MKSSSLAGRLFFVGLSLSSYLLLSACSQDASDSDSDPLSGQQIEEYRITDDPLLAEASERDEIAIPRVLDEEESLVISTENATEVGLSLNYPLVLENSSHETSKPAQVAGTYKDEHPLHISTLQGFYIFGNEANLFSPCGSDKAYWVQTSPEIQSELVKIYRQLTSQAHEEIFVQVTGSYVGSGVEGYAEDSDGLFSIMTLHNMRRRTAGDCGTDDIERRD